MKTKRLLLPVVVAVSAVAAFGCNAEQFTSLNDQFKAVKTQSKTLKAATLPAAAMASSLAAVEIMNAIAQDTQDKQKASGGGQLGNVIAAGGGNVIAPGALNFAVAAAGPTTTTELNDGTGTGKLVSKDGDKTLLDVAFSYSRKPLGDGGYEFELLDLKGQTNGFTVTAAGHYSYKFADSGKKVAQLESKISGTLETKSSDNAFKLDELSFNLLFPNTDPTKRELGQLRMSDDNGAMSATVYIAGSTVTAEGEMKDDKGEVLYTMTMDENGVKTTQGGEN